MTQPTILQMIKQTDIWEILGGLAIASIVIGLVILIAAAPHLQ